MSSSPHRRAIGSLLATALLALAAAGPGAASAPSLVDEPPTVEVPVAEVERVMTRQLDAAGVPGGAFVVVSDGRSEARGVGSAGGSREVTGTTPFVIGSTTKSFTALAVLQLRDSGDVALDAPVRDYVPELRLADGERVDDITVRHVLEHTSGITDPPGAALLASAAEGTALDAVAELEDAALASAPGDAWHYANANYVLAGLVVERASGMSYPDYVQARIFDPLGMTHSHVAAGAAAEADGLARGHRFWFGVPVGTGPTHRSGVLAAGYLVSTAEDLGRYLTMYLEDGVGGTGERVVSAAGVRAMLTAGPEARLGAWADPRESHYGLGWFVGGPWSADSVFHPGNTPDSSAMLALFPERGLAVAVLLDAGHELPVPGNPALTDRVSSNVVAAALGRQVTDAPSLWRFYLVFDLVALAVLAAASWGLVRAIRAVAVRGPRRPGASPRVRRWAGVVVRALAAALVAVLPVLTIGWRGLWTWAPDLALVLTALALLWAGTASLRLRALLLPGQQPGPTLIEDTEKESAHAHTRDREPHEALRPRGGRR